MPPGRTRLRRTARGRRAMASAPGERTAAGGAVMTVPEPGSGPMLDGETLLAHARRVIRSEADALLALEPRLGEPFLQAVERVHQAAGRVIVSGIGKSGIIGRKIAATLTATGTPAVFLHPVEGRHGGLGVVGPEDVAILTPQRGEPNGQHRPVGY